MPDISIKLPAETWNVVLNALAQRPFAEVVDLIAEIKRQGEAALKVDETPTEE